MPHRLAVEEAADGQEAVEAFRRSPQGYYDLILMDIQMPVMDGYEDAGLIRVWTGRTPLQSPLLH